MAKRYNTVRVCPWCGNVPAASETRCKCGMNLPRTSDFEFGLKYLGRTSQVSGAGGENIGEDFAQACKNAVEGNEKAVQSLVIGNSFERYPDRWAQCKEGLAVLAEAAAHGYKWAEYCLGYLYFKGIGGANRDYEKSKRLMLSAATASPVVSTHALQHVCMCYFDGVAGFRRDVDKAYAYYRKVKNRNSDLGWVTLANMLDRTDLCKNGRFTTWDGGRPLIAHDDRKRRKENFEPCVLVRTKLDEDDPCGFSFASQTDGRQLMCLIMEATKSFKKGYVDGKWSPKEHRSSKVLEYSENMFDDWDGLVRAWKGLYNKVGERLGNRLKWIREGLGCACLPGRWSIDGLRGRGLAFRDVYYYDSLWLGRKIGYDQLLFSNYSDYLGAMSKIPNGMKSDYYLEEIKILGPYYFDYLRRYILSDRKAGVLLWDGSIQKECNAKKSMIPIIPEGERQKQKKAEDQQKQDLAAERKKNEIAHQKTEQETKKKERSETRQGCGCLLAILALICLVIWGPDWFSGNVIGDVLSKVRGWSWIALLWIWAMIVAIAKFAWHHWIISAIVLAVIVFKCKS